MSANLVTIDHVSKKFCRDLRRSLWYGFKDIGTELMGRQRGNGQLRKGEFWCLSDVSLEVERGCTIGLIGRNGTGKTTLFRLVLGELGVDDGTINIRARARVGTVAQEAPAGPDSLLERVLAADQERHGVSCVGRRNRDGGPRRDDDLRRAELRGHVR